MGNFWPFRRYVDDAIEDATPVDDIPDDIMNDAYDSYKDAIFAGISTGLREYVPIPELQRLIYKYARVQALEHVHKVISMGLVAQFEVQQYRFKIAIDTDDNAFPNVPVLTDASSSGIVFWMSMAEKNHDSRGGNGRGGDGGGGDIWHGSASTHCGLDYVADYFTADELSAIIKHLTDSCLHGSDMRIARTLPRVNDLIKTKSREAATEILKRYIQNAKMYMCDGDSAKRQDGPDNFPVMQIPDEYKRWMRDDMT